MWIRHIKRLMPALVLLSAALATTFVVTARWRGTVGGTEFIGRTVDDVPSGARVALILVTSPSCRYCQASMPFYHRLAEVAAESGRALALRAVVPLDTESARDYLRDEDLAWDLSPIAADSLRISGTPTLLLVDADRHVKRAWVGLLDKAQRLEVVALAAQLGGPSVIAAAQKIQW
jgi:thiol-disulfide isomerase/thioredoxin